MISHSSPWFLMFFVLQNFSYLREIDNTKNNIAALILWHMIFSALGKPVMKLSEALQKKLSQVYEPSAMIDMRFKGNDVTFKTDEEGNPVLLFVGTRTTEGTIKGDRFARTLKKDREGKIFKDHWELKGKAT